MFESFKNRTSIDWEKQIEKELKGKSIDNLIFTDYSGLEIRPFYHSDGYLHASDVQQNAGCWKPVVGLFLNKENLSLSEEIVRFSMEQGISQFCFWGKLPDNSEIIKHIKYTDNPVQDFKFFERNGTKSNTCANKYLKNDYYHEYVDTLCISEIGASALTELLYGILAIKDLTSVNAKMPVYWVMGVGKNYFTEIAKFRAARIIIQQQFPEVTLTLHGVTGLHYRSFNDQHNNLLRSVTAAMSAILGGCDELTIHPLDIHLQESTLQSYRWANNIHHLLKHESKIDKIHDPVKGSYFLEYLTEQLTYKAVEFLQKNDDLHSKLKDNQIKEIQARTFNLQNNIEVMINVNKHVGKPPVKSSKRRNLYSDFWEILFDEDVVLGFE